MDFNNIPQLTAALSEGRGIFCGVAQSAFFLQSDGSVISVDGAMVAEPNNARAELWKNFSGWNNYVLPVGGNAIGGVKNGGNVTIGEDGQMDAPVSPLDAMVVNLFAVADEAPEVEELGDGTRYFNTTDNKMYILEEGEWVEDDAPATGKLYLADGALYRYDETTHMTLL